jgi:hypothetical protein
VFYGKSVAPPGAVKTTVVAFLFMFDILILRPGANELSGKTWSKKIAAEKIAGW